MSARRSAPLGLALGLVWLAGVFCSSVLVARFGAEDRASWHEALIGAVFAFFGWGWFVTFAVVAGASVVSCVALQWSRPRSVWLPWALPLIVVMLTVLLDAAMRLLDNTQWVTAQGAAEAARTADVASLVSLVIVAAASCVTGLILRRRDCFTRRPELRFVRLPIGYRDAPVRSGHDSARCPRLHRHHTTEGRAQLVAEAA